MKKFLCKDFLLQNETAKSLYHDYAKKMPVIDYHCHINPKEIYEDKNIENITVAWLYGDHYKWRLMRANAVKEEFVTGSGDDKEKFMHWAYTLQTAIGNPLYHWSHMELKEYFGFDSYLSEKNAEEVWDLCNEKLKSPDMTVRNIIRQSNIKLICTTDDPADSLEWHEKLKADTSFDVEVLPAWRPDNAMHIEKPAFLPYIKTLSDAVNFDIENYETLIKALIIRLDYFEEHGCTISDHGPDYIYFAPCSDEKAAEIFKKALNGDNLSDFELEQYKTNFLLKMTAQYHKRKWVMQLHYNCIRNSSETQFNALGRDTGYDCMNNFGPAQKLASFLSLAEKECGLPKTVVYSLNANDNEVIDSVLGSFQTAEFKGKMQHGSAWWFNDHKDGVTAQLKSFANSGLLSTFIGMLTDSRSFLSYTRHEYFRRILCSFLGELVENGEFPCDFDILGKIVSDICYNNAVEYFGFFKS